MAIKINNIMMGETAAETPHSYSLESPKKPITLGHGGVSNEIYNPIINKYNLNYIIKMEKIKMVYRKVIYEGETMKGIIKRLAEIKDRKETIIRFTIEVY